MKSVLVLVPMGNGMAKCAAISGSSSVNRVGNSRMTGHYRVVMSDYAFSDVFILYNFIKVIHVLILFIY